MAEAAKVVKVAKKKRQPFYLEIEQLFMLNKPERVKGKDGKFYEIFHRVGAYKGAYTKDELMKEIGFSSQLAELEKDAQKRYKSIQDVRTVVEGRKTKLVSILNSRVRAFKAALAKLYRQGPNKLIPLVASVRIHSETEERKLFIQGFVNMDGEFVIGGRDDGALWAIEVMNGSRGLAEKFKLAHTVGRDLVQHGLSGPIKERLSGSLKG